MDDAPTHAVGIIDQQGRLHRLRQADEAAHESRWVRTRGGNLAHAVAVCWPVGREAVARCGLAVGGYENREPVAESGTACPTCVELDDANASMAEVR